MRAEPVRCGAALALAATLGACATPEPIEERAEARLLGRPVSNAIELLGPGYRAEPASDGGATYRWVLVEDLLAPGTTGPPSLRVSRRGTGTYQAGRRSAPRLVTRRCEVTTDVGSDDIVSGWRVAGEACIDILRARLR